MGSLLIWDIYSAYGTSASLWPLPEPQPIRNFDPFRQGAFSVTEKTRTFAAQNVQGVQLKGYYSEVPDECPICHRNIAPKTLFSAFAGDSKDGYLHLSFQCPRHKCQSVFIGVYRYNSYAVASAPYYELIRVWPRQPQAVTFGEQISTLSPSFVRIFNQAIAAESAGLEEIFGIGLRKALEYLVKDFAARNAEDEEVKAIRKMHLGHVIEKYIDDASVKACAKRAAWLGNDEAHYLRVWETADISDLKTLIKLTVNGVENVLLMEHYARSMDPQS